MCVPARDPPIIRVVIEGEPRGVSNLSSLFSASANGFYSQGLGQGKTWNVSSFSPGRCVGVWGCWWWLAPGREGKREVITGEGSRRQRALRLWPCLQEERRP